MDKKAGAPIGNKNAEKWDISLESTILLFEEINEALNKKYDYFVNGIEIEGFLCHFIGEACTEAKTNIDRIEYIRDKYNLQHLYKDLKRKSESNCFTDTKKGIINTAAGIMNLKSNHGWTDRLKTENTNSNVNILSIDPLSDASDDNPA